MKCPDCANRFNKFSKREYSIAGLAQHKKHAHSEKLSRHKKTALRRQTRK